MSKTISIGLVLTALGFGGASAALGTVGQRVASIGGEIEKLKARQKDALGNMDREWLWGGNSVKKYAAEVEKLDSKIERLGAKQARLRALGETHQANRMDMNQRYGDTVAAVGIGASLAVPGVKAAKFEDRVKQISIVGELYKQNGAEDAMAQAIRQAAVRNGVAQDKVAEGVEKLVAQGMEANTAKKYAGLLAKVNMATRTEMGDLAELVYTLQTKFKLSTEGEVMQAVNALAKAGKLGQYELKQMAKGFPALGNAAASFGSTGLEGVREMGMMMQVMRAGAGTTGEADTYMSNWFSHMSAASTQKHFEKVGINFEKAKLKLMIDQRVSAVEASFMVFDDYLNKVTKQGYTTMFDKKTGKQLIDVDVRQELAKAQELAVKEGLTGEALQERIKAAVERMGLSGVLQDVQAVQAYLAQRTGKQKYTEGRKELAKSETNQTIDQDYAEQMKLATMQTERMKVAVGELMIEMGNRLAPVFGKVAMGVAWLAEKTADGMKRWPQVTTVLIAIGTTAAIAAAGFFAVGTAMAAMRFAGSALMLMPLLGGGLHMVGVGAMWTGAMLRGALVAGLRFAGQALLFFGRALMSLALNPIGAAIMVIAGGAYLIYRNWAPLSAWFRRVWASVQAGFNSTMAWFKGLPSAFAEFGRHMIDGLVGGITSKIGALKDGVLGAANGVKKWFAEALGIKSPSRVFMGFGENIGAGAELGILSTVGKVGAAVGKLSGVALAGALATGGAMAATQPVQPLGQPAAVAAPALPPLAKPLTWIEPAPVRGQADEVARLMGSLPTHTPAPDAQSGQAAISVSFAPVINVTMSGAAGGAEVREQVNQGLSMGQRELEAMLRRLLAEQTRRGY